MLKVAIVGCGKIADAHASQIGRIKGCEIVGVCDREPLMAQQLSYEVSCQASVLVNLTELLRKRAGRRSRYDASAKPFDFAKLCLERGCHVYVEKPFTLYGPMKQRS